jgi:hypothetical protein
MPFPLAVQVHPFNADKLIREIGFAVLDPYNRLFTTVSTASLVALLGYNYRNETLNWSNKSLLVAVGASLLLRSLPFVIDRLNNPVVDASTVEEVIEVDIEGECETRVDLTEQE